MSELNIKTVDGFPQVMPRIDRVPEFLRSMPYAVWEAEPRPGKQGKFNKAPRCPRTGTRIGADKPELFGTFHTACAALSSGAYSGLGVLLTGGVVGVDIDDYEQAFKTVAGLREWVDMAVRAGAYCERSPSGKGLRLFFRGALPGKGRKHGHLEIYDTSRFLTVTGHKLKTAGTELIEGQALIDDFLRLLPAQVREYDAPPMPRAQEADSAVVATIAERLQERRPATWQGIWEACGDETGYASQSEADYSLLNDIAREAVRVGVAESALHATVAAVFRQSGLFRAEKARANENYAIPKVVQEALATRRAANAVSTREEGGKTLAEHEPGDIMAARVFGQTYRGKLLYVTPAGRWLVWDGTRWVWAARGEEMSAAKDLADNVLTWAVDLTKQDAEKNKKRLAFAIRLQNLPRLEAMLALAKSEPGMSLGHMTELDADPWLLGVRNGAVNLKDGGLLTAAPDMLITRKCAAAYDADAQCPRWVEFMHSIFEGDAETVAFVQRALGYTLTGTTTDEALFICHGFGANGKSVFANTITSIMADYAQAAPASLLTMRKDGDAGPRNDIARLCGARLVQINELQQGDRLDEQVVKMLAGREMLSARFLHKEFFEFWPTAKPWLRTNHRPVVTGEDDGIWRRLHLIPFARKFAEHERDPWLESRLLEERDGILAWMVRGCLDWQRGGLRPSATIRRESAVYRRESDLLGEFLEECTENDKEARVEQQQLFARWRLWNDANGTRSGSKNSFTRKLAERGYTGAKSNGQRFYSGLKATR